jgi:hypothetical protein
VTTIELDRRFIEYAEDDGSDPELRFYLRSEIAGQLDWAALLRRRRVVILAEAGSGKTEEIRHQTRCRSEAGCFAFYATVEDVGCEGLEGALSQADRVRFAAWRESQQPGCFFLDSIDEAKLNRVRLDTALRRVADGIAGATGRAHIVLSGRYSDWEFQRDLGRLSHHLPIPDDRVIPPAPSPDDLLIRTIRRERPPTDETETSAEAPLVVAMAPLNPTQIQIFASAKGAPNVEDFLAQIEAANLWSFARRPLDLDWLVQFWREKGRLGTLTEMLEACLAARLQESNPDRSRVDILDQMRAFGALQRIGAALVFGRTATIAIPDSELTLSRENPPLDLAKVLPDWTHPDQISLMTRPVFDLATFGRVRIHNDNEGTVRAYLAARWLERLRKGDLAQSQLCELLFADTYGLKLIKPSMRETAAWLSIWNEAVAAEVVRREPWVLLTAGDPASLSLALRQDLLRRFVDQLVSDDDILPYLDRNSLKRFSRPDITETVRKCWQKNKHHPEVRSLLLRLIALGPLAGCADLAAEITFGAYDERRDQLFAGHALMATGDDAQKRRYAEHIKANCATLPNAVVWDAIEGLFPTHVSVDDFLGILAAIDVTDRDGGLGLDREGPELTERLTSPVEVDRLLGGLLHQLGPSTRPFGHQFSRREETYLPIVEAAAYRLLKQSPENEVPSAAVDAVLRLSEYRRYHRDRPSWRKPIIDIQAELHRAATRRRLAFWMAAERLASDRRLQGRTLTSVWEMEIVGWRAPLTTDDLDWLLADGPARVAENERSLAIDAALRIWHGSGASPNMLARIEAAAGNDPAMKRAYDEATRPRQKSPEEIESERELAEATRQHAVEQAAFEQSWKDFIASLRADPDQLRNLRPTTSDGADRRLFSLWDLLSNAQDSSSRYAIDNIAPLELMIGADLTAAMLDGMSAHWRAWQPRPKSTRPPNRRNEISTLDCMGIAAITLEAKFRSGWAELLGSEDALKAATYATLELNGSPGWLSALAVAKPAEVRQVLTAEIVAELDNQNPDLRCEVLEDAARADERIQALIAPHLLAELESRPDLRRSALRPLLAVIGCGSRSSPDSFCDLAIRRFNAATDPDIAGLYIGAAFGADHSLATTALTAKLDTLAPDAQTALAQRVLPYIFGRMFPDDETKPPVLSFENLQRLVLMAFRTIRPEDDQLHDDGKVFSPNDRDDAQRARDAAFNRLVQTPGRATFEALHRFAETPGFPVDRHHLHKLACERAAADSEVEPWLAQEARAFELTCETAPMTGKDLQVVTLHRFSDMQEDLLHGDFNQGKTLSGLPDERAVQNWTADRLRITQGRSFSVEREPHAADEKEPDIRLRAKASDANVAVEVKVAESWTLQELEDALTDQLCRRYLRAKDNRHGILLLVHQRPRPRGWAQSTIGAVLKFCEVVSHLKTVAAKIAAETWDAPQPEVAVLDVSSFSIARTAKTAKMAPKRQKKKVRA